MAQGMRRPHEAVDFAAIERMYPPPPEYFESAYFEDCYTIDDIRKSIDEHPPFGDYQGITPERSLLEPMRVYMSGGTTGKSRPTFYTMWDRIAGAVFTARALYQLGIRPGDTVLNSWLYGTHNGAW